jgi:hypothetical protein
MKIYSAILKLFQMDRRGEYVQNDLNSFHVTEDNFRRLEQPKVEENLI